MKHVNLIFGVIFVSILVGCSGGDKAAGPIMSVSFEQPGSAGIRGVVGQQWRVENWVITTECDDNVVMTVTESPFCLIGQNLRNCKARPVSFVLNGATYTYSGGFNAYGVGEFGIYVNADDSTDSKRIQIINQIPNPITARFDVKFLLSHVASGGKLFGSLIGATGSPAIGSAPVMPLNMVDMNYVGVDSGMLSFSLPVRCDQWTVANDGGHFCESVRLEGLYFKVVDYVPGTVVDTAYLDSVLVGAPTLSDGAYSSKVVFVTADQGASEHGGFNFTAEFPNCFEGRTDGCPTGTSHSHIIVAKYDHGSGGISYIYWTVELTITMPPTETGVRVIDAFDPSRLAIWRGYLSDAELQSPLSEITSGMTKMLPGFLQRKGFFLNGAKSAYIPGGNGWYLLKNHGSVIGRFLSSSSVVGSKIVIFGGKDNFLEFRNDVWAFDTADYTWTRLKEDDPAGVEGRDYPKRRFMHTLSSVGSKVVIYGGFDSQYTLRNDVWAFDTEEKKWSILKDDNPSGTENVDYPGKRIYHSQSTIGSSVLIYGGNANAKNRSDVWAFNTLDNTWRKLKGDEGTEGIDYPEKRGGHSQSTMGAKIIIFGGRGEKDITSYRNDVWAFDTVNSTWTKLKENNPEGAAGGNYPIGRYCNGQSTFGSKIIIYGGLEVYKGLPGGQYRGDIWAFDTADNSWAKLVSDDSGLKYDVDQPMKRGFHSQVTFNSDVIIFGGNDNTGSIRNDVWRFNLADKKWSKLRSDGYLGIVDKDFPKRRYLTSQSTVGSKVVIYSGTLTRVPDNSDVWTFDTKDNSWAKLKAIEPQMAEDVDYPKKRIYQSQSTVGSKIIIFGGDISGALYVIGTLTNDVWAFNVEDKSWEKLKGNNPEGMVDVDYPVARSRHSQSTLGEKIIIFGGVEKWGKYRNDVWAFDTTTNTWTKLKEDVPDSTNTDVPRPRYLSSQAAIGSKIIVFGGLISKPPYAVEYTNDVWAFDTTTNTWTKLKDHNPAGIENVDYPKAAFYTISAMGVKVIAFGGGGGVNDIIEGSFVWAFDTTNNSWANIATGRHDEQIIGIDRPNNHSTFHSQSTVGSRIVVVGGTENERNTTGKERVRTEVWAFDTSHPQSNQVLSSLLAFDLSDIEASIIDDIRLTMHATASGNNNGRTDHGITLSAWDGGTGDFKVIQSNNAATLSDGAMSADIPGKYRTSDGEIYFLLSGRYGQSGTINSVMELNCFTLRLSVPYAR